jgi:hypothetical protein
VMVTLENLQIVDEKGLSWDQVVSFREDTEARKKYRRFLHWLDKEMVVSWFTVNWNFGPFGLAS